MCRSSGILQTYTAHILVAVNPFKDIPIFEGQYLTKYRGKSIGQEEPHIYAVADNAYRAMKATTLSQSIIVSGESGAGKTESCKFIMKYLANLGGVDGHLSSLEETILEANPVLESFGNAKTIRNKNSSRFGKFTEIHFDNNFKLSGAAISHYLLEKSRIVTQNADERNYHIFYELCAGASVQQKAAFTLMPAKDFRYLANCVTVEGFDDVAHFNNTFRAFKTIGLSDEEINGALSVCAAVLHIGNIDFEETTSGTTAGGSVVKDPAGAYKPAAVAAGLLGCDVEKFKEALTTRMMSAVGKGAAIRKELKAVDALSARDALAKAVYKNLFDWLVARINHSLPLTSSSSFIGVLDIAGFEYFENNSYEQFCINYCNEKLQGFFNEKVLKQEQDIYRKEGIRVDPIEYLNNDDAIELIEDPKTGIFALLDEETKMPQANDKRFTTTVHDKHGKHPKFSGPRKAPLKSNQKLKDDEAFLVRHYAGAVCYNTAFFIDKNNDALHTDMETMLAGSSVPFVKALIDSIPAEEKAAPGKLSFFSVGAKFKKQMKELMGKLLTTNAHFVRCVKPNFKQVPNFFDGVDVLQQLHCGGMLEALELMQKGFPSRTDFQSLYDQYKVLLPPKLQALSPRTFCEALIFSLGSNANDFQFGLTKVFFRAGKYALLDEITRQDESMSKVLIAKVLRYLTSKRWRRAMYAAIASQRLMGKIKYRAEARVTVQTISRALIARKNLVHQIETFKQARIAHEIELARQREAAEKERKAKEAAEKERQRLEALKAAEEKRQREEEEAEKKAAADAAAERARYAEEVRRLEEAEKNEDALQKSLEAQAAAAAAEAAKNEGPLREEAERVEQARRDEELASRLARDNHQTDAVDFRADAGPTPQVEFVETESGAVYDLSKWSYAQLRDTINTSSDVEMLQACRNEFQKRLKAYYSWKTKYDKGDEAPQESAVPMQQVREAPRPVRSVAPRVVPMVTAVPRTVGPPPAAASGLQRQATMARDKKVIIPPPPPAVLKILSLIAGDRFFRVPFTRPIVNAKGKQVKKKGLWWAHFEGPRIKRQLETHADGLPVLLIAGRDDAQMCDLSLAETGLLDKRDAEISKATFEEEWQRCSRLLEKETRGKKAITVGN